VQYRQNWKDQTWEAFVCQSPEVGCVVGCGNTKYTAVYDLLRQLEGMERDIKAAVAAALQARSKE
jgi:hypothetical protein